jgi:hypothetical protein
MELDDLKNTWNAAKSPLQNQQNINPEMLEKMSNQKYRSKLKKITIPELTGSIVCLAAAVFIGFSFDKLDTVLLQGAGVLSILLLLLLPAISSLSTWKLSKPSNLNKPYAETLKAFANQKIRFIKLQKLNVTLSYLLLVSIIVLLSKLFSGKDLFDSKYFWLFSFTIGYIFLLFYSKWVDNYYRKKLQQAEELLGELAN